MRSLLLVCVVLSLLGCQETSSTRTVAEILRLPEGAAPASAPPVYANFSAAADLFEQANDTTYLINFWATWCKPCLEELPLLAAIQEEHMADGLRVILISLDTEEEAIRRIPSFLERQGVELPTIVVTDEGEAWKRELDEHWGGNLPTTFIYKNSLRYVYRRNFRTLPDVREAVAPLLPKT